MKANGVPKARVLVVPEKEFDERVAESLARALKDGTSTGPANLTLAGGATPRGGYQRLCHTTALRGEILAGLPRQRREDAARP